MDISYLAISIIWVFVFAYSILGSIDFGAGFWSMAFMGRKNSHMASIANRYLSPTWEVTNVFLVLVVVAMVGFFPNAVYVLGTVLLVPVCLTLILLLIRSTFMVFAYSVDKYYRQLRIISGLTGLLIPGLLVSVLPISLGGFIEVTNGVPRLLMGKLFSSVTEYAHLGFGLSSELFLSALFLADYASEANDRDAYPVYRRAAIVLGPVTLAMAALTTGTFSREAEWILMRIEGHAPWFYLSVAAFIVGYSALWFKRKGENVPGWPRFAITAVITQYLLASIGYGAAHLPYLVYPFITVQQGITNPEMFYSLLWGYAAGTAILVPCFYWFWKLFLKDKRYLQEE